MDKEKELNIIFKKLGWKLLPEDNEYPFDEKIIWVKIIIGNSLYINRDYIPYEKYTNKFTIKELDNYVVEFIKNICLKHGIKTIVFGDKNHDNNSINLK